MQRFAMIHVKIHDFKGEVSTRILLQPLLLTRLAYGNMSIIPRHGVHLEVILGSMKTSKEFLVKRSAVLHQIILGLEILED